MTSFSELPLAVNRGDAVRVRASTGALTAGQVVGFGRDGLLLGSSSGAQRFTEETVRAVEVRRGSALRGALLGAGTFLVIGLVGCPEDAAAGCPAFAALLWGAPLGAIVGTGIRSWHTVYRGSETSAAAPPRPLVEGGLRSTLGMMVNRGDRVIVESTAGGTATGAVSWLTDDGVGLRTAGESATRDFPASTIRKVSTSRGRARLGALLGFAGLSAVCLPSAGSDWPDAFVLCGLPGAGIGALIGSRFRQTAEVYPGTTPALSVTPAIGQHRMGIRASYRF